MKMSWRGRRTSAILLLTFILILGFSSSFVRAQPTVPGVTASKSGDHTILTLEITQEDLDGFGDYDFVTAVAVKLDGGEPIVQNVTASAKPVITVKIDLGVLEGRPQAELSICTVNWKWTPWFEPFEVPAPNGGPPPVPGDYAIVILGVGVAISAVLAVYAIFKRKRKNSGNK